MLRVESRIYTYLFMHDYHENNDLRTENVNAEKGIQVSTFFFHSFRFRIESICVFVYRRLDGCLTLASNELGARVRRRRGSDRESVCA